MFQKKKKNTTQGLEPTLNLKTDFKIECQRDCLVFYAASCCWQTTKGASCQRPLHRLLWTQRGSSLGDILVFLALCFVRTQILTQSAAHKHAQSNKRASVQRASIHSFLSRQRQRGLFSSPSFAVQQGKVGMEKDLRDKGQRKKKSGFQKITENKWTRKEASALCNVMEKSFLTPRSYVIARPLR